MGKILGIAIKNYGSLKDIKMGQLYSGQTGVPLGNMVAIIGPSGNGKSTLADAFGFIADALTTDVESACDASNRGGYDKLVSQGSNGPIHFEIYYKENSNSRPITYELTIGKDKYDRPYVKDERLRQRRPGNKSGRPLSFLYLIDGKGYAFEGAEGGQDDEGVVTGSKVDVELSDIRKLGIVTLGAMKQYSRIDRFQRVEDRFSALAEILEAPEKNAAKLERNAKDAVANFLYSFNECLDHWRTYIVRAYGEGSNYFSAYQKLTTLAFDTYDEYKITYALRNFQHVDDVFDGISVRLGMPAQIYAHRQRLLDNSRFTAPQRAAFTKLEECFDLFPIFKTAKEQLEQIEKKLMFYTVTPEQENKAIDALKFKEELCGPHGVLLLGKLLDPNGNELEATDSTIIKLAQEQSEASLSYQDEIPWGVCRLLQLFQGTNYQDI